MARAKSMSVNWESSRGQDPLGFLLSAVAMMLVQTSTQYRDAVGTYVFDEDAYVLGNDDYASLTVFLMSGDPLVSLVVPNGRRARVELTNHLLDLLDPPGHLLGAVEQDSDSNVVVNLGIGHLKETIFFGPWLNVSFDKGRVTLTSEAVKQFENFLDEYLPLDESDDEPVSIPRRSRVERLSGDDQHAVSAAFEVPVRSLSELTQSKELDDYESHFISNTLQQLRLWTERLDASPQIFELLMADVVKVVLKRLLDPEPLRQELFRLGADEYLANAVSDRVVESIEAMTSLGTHDAVEDATALDRIADSFQSISVAVSGLEQVARQSEKTTSKFKDATAASVGAAAGASLVSLVKASWPNLQIGLMMAWHNARQFIVSRL